MRWTVFLIVAVVALALDLSFRNVFVIQSLGNLAPCFTAIVVVYVALTAPRDQAMWAAWILGILVDLATDLPQGVGRAGPIIGPYAIGFPFATFALLQIRAMLLRRSALTHAVVAVFFVVVASLVACFVYAVHDWYPNEQIGWADHGLFGEMWRRFGGAVYTGVLALPLARLLVASTPAWGFRFGAQRHATWR